MRTLTPLLALLVVGFFTTPSRAQPHTAEFRSCPSSDGCNYPDIKPHVPLLLATEDWSLRYASGRSTLSTFVPIALGRILSEIDEAYTDDSSMRDPLSVMSLGLFGVGAITGPSMGEWCLGGDCARRSLFPLSLRVAGAAEMVWAFRWGVRKSNETPGQTDLTLIPVVAALMLPGMVLLSTGMAWSLHNAPRVLCASNRSTATSSLRVAPTTLSDVGGMGWALQVRW